MPNQSIRFLAVFSALIALASVPSRAASHAVGDSAATSRTQASAWSPSEAAKYLDSRELWWQEWPQAQKDHGTICISCHTQIPYALARPLLRKQLGETTISAPEQAMLASIRKRVELGNQATTFYTDAEHGAGKTLESRNAEQVFNALILASYDASTGHLQPLTRTALDRIWTTQVATGPKAGAWIWQNFHFSPWEAPESEYFGATMALMAVAIAPDNYRDTPAIQPNLARLRGYIAREAAQQPLANRMVLLWVSGRWPGLISASEQAAIASEIAAKQQPDGGWSLTTLGQGTWKRHDSSPFATRSDGYATALAVLALKDSGQSAASQTPLKRGVAWLLANQNPATGQWPAWSVNVKRDPNSDVGKFMSDAATGFAVLALDDHSGKKK
jgi:hypothetical protein